MARGMGETKAKDIWGRREGKVRVWEKGRVSPLFIAVPMDLADLQ
jgi:hypothetical protein